MERLELVELYQQRQKERKKNRAINKRFRINPNGDVYLILVYYSKNRGISVRNTRTGKEEFYSCNLFVIPERE